MILMHVYFIYIVTMSVAYMYILVFNNRLNLFDFIFLLYILLLYTLSSATLKLRLMTVEFVATRLKRFRTMHPVEMIDDFNKISIISLEFVVMFPKVRCSSIM